MNEAKLEHINITVADPLVTAAMLAELFDWEIRWQGDAIHGGFTVHVGGEGSYMALYSRGQESTSASDSFNQLTGLNHIGIVVDDLKEAEAKVITAGFKTHSHGDYEPGRRFYFEDQDGLEFEIVSY